MMRAISWCLTRFTHLGDRVRFTCLYLDRLFSGSSNSYEVRGLKAIIRPRARGAWPKGSRVGELMATQSGRILLGALDRMVYSSAHYWVAMLSDLAAALAFLALGLHRFSGPWLVAGGVAIVGLMSYGLLEYVVHRWVLHGPPSMARRGHAQHHAEPRALISTPLFVIMTGALAIWGLLGLVLPAGLAALLVFGLYAGYNYFALVHHRQHHRGKDVAGVA
jgi:hypothetical protein